jgi:cation diffusion facilitator family transporter
MADTKTEHKKSNKQAAALSSVIAAIFLTALKIVVGIMTGSLGIISEAAHSALDLCAAVITLFAVRFSDKPADQQHHYGHGKIESFSALIETVLLLITCGWIIYEAIEKLFFGKSIEITGSHWGIATMVVAIIIDYSRAKILKRAAVEHGSQALEADALHFSSDVWSSSVVIAGLAFVWAGDYFKLPALSNADPIAALGVALLVIRISLKLGKETIDVLLDTAPRGMRESVLREVGSIKGILEVSDVRIRPSGPMYFIDISVGIDRNESHKAVHKIIAEIKTEIHKQVPRSDIIISTFPVDVIGISDRGIYHTVKRIADKFPNCTNIHNIHIYDIGGKKKIAAHIELKENLTLSESHELAHKISRMIQSELEEIDHASIYFECADQRVDAVDVTRMRRDLIDRIKKIIKSMTDNLNCHDITLFQQGDIYTTFLHCELNDECSVAELELLSKNIIQELKRNIENLENVHIHFEPVDVVE